MDLQSGPGMGAGDTTVTVSVVVPVYSGAAYLKELFESVGRIRSAWERENAPVRLVEVVFVDDEALDDSPRVLAEITAEEPWARVLHLSRNYGQHPATIAGILHSSGDWIVTMDEDLKHPPEKIEQMLHHAASNALDIVYTNGEGETHENLLRDKGSKAFKRLLACLAGDRNITSFSSFRVIRGSVARAASSVCGHDTYLDVALSWFSRRVGSLTFTIKDSRVIGGGRSGYSFRKLVSHARRMLLSAHVKPLRIGAATGVLSMTLAFLFGGLIVAVELLHPGSFEARGWGSLMVTNMFFGGLLLFLIGVVLEYLAIVVLRAQGKPVFFAVDRTSDTWIAPYLGRRIGC